MACPLDATTGFQTLQGPIGPTLLSDIAVKQAPFIITFAPRQTPPALVGNHVDESTDNIILMKGERYRLMDVQICTPTHDQGIKTETQKPPELDLVLTFYCTRPANIMAPKLLLVIFPIYVSNEESRAGYLRQLIDTNQPAASIQTLMYDKDEKDTKAASFEYLMCIDLVNPDNFKSTMSLNAIIFYFPVGCTINQQHLETFKKDATYYRLPPALLDGFATVMTYDVVNGVKSVGSISTEGQIPSSSISVTPNALGHSFTSIFQYNLKPPALSSNFDKNSCPYYKTSQYKCVPFNQMSDLSGEYVVPKDATTLDNIIKERDELVAGEKGDVILSWQAILGWIGGVIGGLLLLAAIYFGFSYVNTLNVEPPSQGTPLSMDLNLDVDV